MSGLKDVGDVRVVWFARGLRHVKCCAVPSYVDLHGSVWICADLC